MDHKWSQCLEHDVQFHPVTVSKVIETLLHLGKITETLCLT
jgi:hypothetical protein